jgi:hypothetical protein
MTFGRKEKVTFYTAVLLKALLPAVLPQVLHLIAFGELLIALEPDLVEAKCPGSMAWVDIVRCDGMKGYSGRARMTSGTLVFVEFVVCIVVSSAGFVHRFLPVAEQLPWTRNQAWLVVSSVAAVSAVLYGVLTSAVGTAAALSWYFYAIAVISPILCLIAVEFGKRPEQRLEIRAEKLRRLQFETRLGAWSPR